MGRNNHTRITDADGWDTAGLFIKKAPSGERGGEKVFEEGAGTGGSSSKRKVRRTGARPTRWRQWSTKATAGVAEKIVER